MPASFLDPSYLTYTFYYTIPVIKHFAFKHGFPFLNDFKSLSDLCLPTAGI